MATLSIQPKPISFFELHGQLVAHEILLNSSVSSAPMENVVQKGHQNILSNWKPNHFGYSSQ